MNASPTTACPTSGDSIQGVASAPMLKGFIAHGGHRPRERFRATGASGAIMGKLELRGILKVVAVSVLVFQISL